MVHPDRMKYKINRDELGQFPHFTDLTDARFSHHAGMMTGGNVTKQQFLSYMQWLHCVGNWGEEHSMCKKARWFVESMVPDFMLEKYEEKRALGHFDYTLLYGAAPYEGFKPLYQPVKKNRPGMYEFWKDRDFEPIIDHEEAGDWRIHAPVLHDIFVKGKKPIYDNAEDE